MRSQLVRLAAYCVAALFSCVAFSADVPGARELRDCDVCPAMVVVPAGSFTMGTVADGEEGRPESPVHIVRLRKPFALGKYEVTNAEFRAFVEATGYRVAPGCRIQDKVVGPRGRIEWRDDPAADWQSPGFLEPLQNDRPVVCVGRVDALAYVAWLAQRTGQRYRLPSESEWEYAARAGGAGSYPWGSNPDVGCRHANMYDRSGHARLEFGWSFADCDDSQVELAPVGRYAPNAFGLHDMIGNVWEWNADCYRQTYDGAPADGSPVTVPGCTLWSVRGGAWMTRPSRNRLTFRGRDPNDARYSYFGIRVARDLRP